MTQITQNNCNINALRPLEVTCNPTNASSPEAQDGSIQLYINVFLWFFEKDYVYPSIGPFKYFTYYWGNFIYWGLASMIYGLLRIYGYVI